MKILSSLQKISPERRSFVKNAALLVYGLFLVITMGLSVFMGWKGVDTLGRYQSASDSTNVYALKWTDHELSPVTIVERPRPPARSSGWLERPFDPGTSKLVVKYNGTIREFTGPVEIVKLAVQPVAAVVAEKASETQFNLWIQNNNIAVRLMIILAAFGFILFLLIGLWESGRILAYKPA